MRVLSYITVVYWSLLFRLYCLKTRLLLIIYKSFYFLYLLSNNESMTDIKYNFLIYTSVYIYFFIRIPIHVFQRLSNKADLPTFIGSLCFFPYPANSGGLFRSKRRKNSTCTFVQTRWYAEKTRNKPFELRIFDLPFDRRWESTKNFTR